MERRVYHYLIDFLAENTYQPSIREIARKFRIKSTKTVSDLLIALADKGYIERQDARSRGVRLLGYATSTQTQPVPLYARINTGEPALTPENRRSFVTLDRRFLPSADVFLVAMRGDGIPGRGIINGDLVLVSPSARAKDGDMVAVRNGHDAMVKPFTQDDDGILGVVCGVFRPFHERQPAATELDSPESA
jgi:repressor LexA